MAGVDLVDDLQMSGQYFLEHGHGPPLQGLRQQGVVGVGKGLGAHVPGLFPANFF